jgi:large subunit ribosomal protein L24
MQKIKKGDQVQIAKGKDRGKKGKVLEVFRESGRALVEGLNLIKKHRRRTQQDQQGGIVSLESPVSLANLMLVCKSCGRATRAGFTVLKDGSKARFCKSCKEAL